MTLTLRRRTGFGDPDPGLHIGYLTRRRDLLRGNAACGRCMRGETRFAPSGESPGNAGVERIRHPSHPRQWDALLGHPRRGHRPSPAVAVLRRKRHVGSRVLASELRSPASRGAARRKHGDVRANSHRRGFGVRDGRPGLARPLDFLRARDTVSSMTGSAGPCRRP